MADTTPNPTVGTSTGNLSGDVSAPHPLDDRPDGPVAEHAGTPTIEQMTTEFAARAKEIALELLGALRDCAASLADEQKTHAANEVAALGDVVHRSVQSLADGDRATYVARYADEAARQIRQFADGLRHRSLAEIGADLDSFAERWPLSFMAASVGVGLMAGRLLASSASRPAAQPAVDPQTTQPFASPPAGGSADPTDHMAHGDGAFGGTAAGGATPGAAAASALEGE
jgi:hypothetical protein